MLKLRKHLPLILLVIFFAVTTVIVNSLIGLDDIRNASVSIGEFYEANSFLVAALFMLLYTASTALSLPLAGVLTVSAGAIFGVALGVPLVVISATLGGIIPFLLVRNKFGDSVAGKYPKASKVLVKELNKSNGLYLLSARLAPIFPFYVVNAVSGLSEISLKKYIIITAFGIVPGTSLYVFAGTEIEKAIQDGQLVRPQFLYLLIGLGVFSLLTTVVKTRSSVEAD